MCRIGAALYLYAAVKHTQDATTSRATFFCDELMTKRTHTKNSRKKEMALYAFARIGTGGDLLSKGSIGRPISNTGRVRSVLLVAENCYVFFR